MQNIILICIPLESTSISSAVIYQLILSKMNQILVADSKFLLSFEAEKDKKKKHQEVCPGMFRTLYLQASPGAFPHCIFNLLTCLF